MTTLDEYATGLGLTFHARQVERRPDGLMRDMPAGTRHYLYAFENPMTGKGMSGYFSAGPGIAEPPTLADVLECLANDAAGWDNAESLDDWASEYGYDALDDRARVTDIYTATEEQTDRLRVLLGPDYDRLLWETDR